MGAAHRVSHKRRPSRCPFMPLGQLTVPRKQAKLTVNGMRNLADDALEVHAFQRRFFITRYAPSRCCANIYIRPCRPHSNGTSRSPIDGTPTQGGAAVGANLETMMQTPKPTRNAIRPATALRIESLESRRLMSVSVQDDGVVVVTGTDGDDQVQIFATD